MKLRDKVRQMIRRGTKDARMVISNTDGDVVESCHIADYRDIDSRFLDAECGDLRGQLAIVTFNHYKTCFVLEMKKGVKL